MSAEDRESVCANINISLAFLKADPMADRIGITYEINRQLDLRTIGASDVRKPDRDKLRRQRWNAKRRSDKAAMPKKLSERERVILGILERMADKGTTVVDMGDLQRAAARHRLFRDLMDVPSQVRRDAEKLAKAGHVSIRKESSERGGFECYVWLETPLSIANPEFALRKTPIFIGSNRRAKSGVNSRRDSIGGQDSDAVEVIDIGTGERAPGLAGAQPDLVLVVGHIEIIDEHGQIICLPADDLYDLDQAPVAPAKGAANDPHVERIAS
jgi:hypothetical protein